MKQINKRGALWRFIHKRAIAKEILTGVPDIHKAPVKILNTPGIANKGNGVGLSAIIDAAASIIEKCTYGGMEVTSTELTEIRLEIFNFRESKKDLRECLELYLTPITANDLHAMRLLSEQECLQMAFNHFNSLYRFAVEKYNETGTMVFKMLESRAKHITTHKRQKEERQQTELTPEQAKWFDAAVTYGYMSKEKGKYKSLFKYNVQLCYFVWMVETRILNRVIQWRPYERYFGLKLGSMAKTYSQYITNKKPQKWASQIDEIFKGKVFS